MARRKDAEDDRPSRIVLDQLNTKTVGAPPSSTGLTGDQLPETIFDVDDFDLVRNQVTLQLQNLELLNVLNTIGQVTNTQSQSGPMPKTAKVITKTESSGTHDFFIPAPGEVWQVTAVSTGTINAGAIVLNLRDGDDNRVELGQESSSNVVFNPTFTGPTFIDNNVYLAFTISSTTGTNTVNASFIRVR